MFNIQDLFKKINVPFYQIGKNDSNLLFEKSITSNKLIGAAYFIRFIFDFILPFAISIYSIYILLDSFFKLPIK